MTFKSSYKKIFCLLLASLMLLTTGCVETVIKKKKPKKVVVVEEVIVKNNDDDSTNTNSTVDVEQNDTTGTTTTKKTLPDRPLPEENSGNSTKYVEIFEPEFEYEYADWSGPDGYTVVYSHSEPHNRIPAANLVTYFKDNYNVDLGLPVKDNSDEAAAATKKILVGDTIFKSSSLKETEYAVTLLSNGDLFFEGGHYALVESAEEWFETVEIKKKKVAVLCGTQDTFASTVTINGKTLNYVWGDEFDGDALIDSEKWAQGAFSHPEDMAQIHGDRHFNSVENGRLRMTADVFYDETDDNVRYAFSGSTRTSGTMSFRNGYVEFRARLPFDKGAFPALWSLSANNNLEKQLPNYAVDDGYGVYGKRLWDLEFDLFESFSDEDSFTTTVHKWYTPSNENILLKEIPDENGKNVVNLFFNYGDGLVNVTDKYKYVGINSTTGLTTATYFWAYPDLTNCGDPDGYWRYMLNEEQQKTINQEYHIYSYYYTSDHVTVYFDGVPFLDFDWDINFDYKDLDGDGKNDDLSLNNMGVGYNFWHYLILEMMLYTPAREDKAPEDVADPSVMPHNMYIDYVRIYQDPTDASQAIYFPNGQD